jgi:tRNA nucleotidyltransferase (CCA-adding enzyme)
LAEAKRGAIMRQLDAIGLLNAIHPSLGWDDSIEARWAQVHEFRAPSAWGLDESPDEEAEYFALWMLDLPPDRAMDVLKRFHLPGWMERIVLEASRIALELRRLPSKAKPSEVTAVLDDGPEASLVAVWLAGQDKGWIRDWIDRYLSQWRRVRPKTDGEQLRRHGLDPGPAYGEILDALRAGWLDGDIQDEADERSALKRLLEGVSQGG